jgi:hypothetical protein
MNIVPLGSLNWPGNMGLMHSLWAIAKSLNKRGLLLEESKESITTKDI